MELKDASIDCYFQLLEEHKNKKQDNGPLQFSFADRKRCTTMTSSQCLEQGEHELKRTLMDIADLMSQICDNSTINQSCQDIQSQFEQNEFLENVGIVTQESHRQVDETQTSDTDMVSVNKDSENSFILKGCLKKVSEDQAGQLSDRNQIIDTLESATEKIIQGLQGLTKRYQDNLDTEELLFTQPTKQELIQSQKFQIPLASSIKAKQVKSFQQKPKLFKPLCPNQNVLNQGGLIKKYSKSHKNAIIQSKRIYEKQKVPAVERLYELDKQKEQKLQKLREDKQKQEGELCQKQTKKKNLKTDVNQIPLFKRVDEIMSNKNKWIQQQQQRKVDAEDKFISSLSFQPVINPQESECTDLFIEKQKQWLERKNNNLISQKLEKERLLLTPLTFKPQLCQKSQDILKNKSQLGENKSDRYNSVDQKLLFQATFRSDRGQQFHFNSNEYCSSRRYESLGKAIKEIF